MCIKKYDTTHIINYRSCLVIAKTNTLHIRIEPNVKQRAEKTLNDLDLSITEAINVFLNQVILHDGIPFEIIKPKYNKETIQVFEDTEM